MRIAVTYENGQVFQHFGHSKMFKFYDVENSVIVHEEVVRTMGSGHGALAGFLQMFGVGALICGGIGGGARNALAQAGGNKTRIKKILAKFRYEMRDGDYNVRGHNFNAAVDHKRPTTYDRLALCCVSVFALSHWRNAVTVKHYMV